MNTVSSLFLAGIVLGVMGCASEKKKGNDFIDRMETEHQGDSPVANAAAAIPQGAEVDTATVSYAMVGGNRVSGYLAKPQDAADDMPGIIVIHEWWGLNDNIRMMTRRLAGEGYVALAVDLYNGKAADSPEMAGQYAREAGEHPEQAIDNLKQAYAYLTNEEGVGNVGTIGWCFGGGWSLQAALALPNKIDATVIYYGRLVTDPAKLKPLRMPILGLFGSEDQGIPPDEVHKFEAVLDSLGKDASIHIYEGANHAFANPSGTRYNKEAAEDAWNKTVSFFATNLK